MDLEEENDKSNDSDNDDIKESIENSIANQLRQFSKRGNDFAKSRYLFFYETEMV